MKHCAILCRTECSVNFFHYICYLFLTVYNNLELIRGRNSDTLCIKISIISVAVNSRSLFHFISNFATTVYLHFTADS